MYWYALKETDGSFGIFDFFPNEVVLTAINIASEKWKNAFNNADAKGCAAQYESDAVILLLLVLIPQNLNHQDTNTLHSPSLSQVERNTPRFYQYLNYLGNKLADLKSL